MTTVKIENASEAVVEQEKTYEAGDFFLVDGELAQLVQTDTNKCCLAKIISGNRWLEPKEVQDSSKITVGELNKMTSYFIVPVKSVKITYEI